jgi:hypothetical protein
MKLARQVSAGRHTLQALQNGLHAPGRLHVPATQTCRIDQLELLTHPSDIIQIVFLIAGVVGQCADLNVRVADGINQLIITTGCSEL